MWTLAKWMISREFIVVGKQDNSALELWIHIPQIQLYNYKMTLILLWGLPTVILWHASVSGSQIKKFIFHNFSAWKWLGAVFPARPDTLFSFMALVYFLSGCSASIRKKSPSLLLYPTLVRSQRRPSTSLTGSVSCTYLPQHLQGCDPLCTFLGDSSIELCHRGEQSVLFLRALSARQVAFFRTWLFCFFLFSSTAVLTSHAFVHPGLLFIL